MARYYEITIAVDETDDGVATFLITAPAFPEITTSADTLVEASDQGLNAIEEAIAARIADGEDVPVPGKETGDAQSSVELPILSFLKIALYTLCRMESVSRAELGRRLGWHREQVDRLFRLDHNSRLDQLEAAFKAIGTSLSLDIPALDVAA